MDAAGLLQSLFTYYLEQGGWLWFSLIPTLILIFVLVDNQRHQRRALMWIIMLIFCLLAFVPAAIYELSNGGRLGQSTRFIFYLGVTGTIAPVFILIGYWFAYRRRNERIYPPSSLSDEHSEAEDDNLPTLVPADGIVADQKLNRKTGGLPETLPVARPVWEQGGSTTLNFENNTTALPGALRPYDRVPETRLIGDAQPHQVKNAPRKELVPAWLVDKKGQHYQLYRGKTSLGRGGQGDINFSDDTVSHRHAMIEQLGSVFVLRDTGSRSGTYLNSIKVDPGESKQLYSNDMIRMGELEVRFVTAGV